ncbi:glycosyltransferase family 4 protein [Bosea psychrotolerans]|uniref:Alpha-1,3-mannosyltransferase n=1 Tax=Bosea psychrotolerans TaxID=1871628 RepID=A0A2S4M817_9HYPH|nr:glycosyltransferase family 4 protein [Bosea psychrotolerans]POR50886.1 alpha-1,3-mannosyltransferase [Bosea psychrotolerans]
MSLQPQQSAPSTMRRGMRIVHVVRQFLPNRGGLEDVVANLCKEQLRMGLAPSVVTLDRLFARPDVRLPREEVINGIPIRRIPYFGSSRYPLAPSIFAYLGDAEIVHVHAVDFFFDALAIGWMLHRKPLVATTHGGFFHTADFSVLKKIWFNGPTRLSSRAYRAIAACSANDARTFENVAAGHVHLIENGVDLDKFAEASSSVPVRRIVSIGRFSKNKRPDHLIATMAELLRSGDDWHLDMIGVASDWSESELRDAVAQAGLADHIALHFELDDAAVRALMSQASLFVSASEFEGFGLAVIEAMSAGLMPIVQPNAAFTALAKKHPLIRLANFADPVEAAETIADAFTTLSNGNASLASAKAELSVYSWRHVAQSYQWMYNSALRRTNRIDVPVGDAETGSET